MKWTIILNTLNIIDGYITKNDKKKIIGTMSIVTINIPINVVEKSSPSLEIPKHLIHFMHWQDLIQFLISTAYQRKLSIKYTETSMRGRVNLLEWKTFLFNMHNQNELSTDTVLITLFIKSKSPNTCTNLRYALRLHKKKHTTKKWIRDRQPRWDNN